MYHITNHIIKYNYSCRSYFMAETNIIIGSLLSTYYMCTMILGFYLYYKNGCRNNGTNTHIIHRGKFLWYSFMFHILFWVPTVIAVFIENYFVFIVSGIVLVFKILFAKKHILEIKLLNKYSLETKSEIEKLLSTQPIGYIQAECWHDKYKHFVEPKNANEKYYKSISLMPSYKQDDIHITKIHRHFFNIKSVDARNQIPIDIPMLTKNNTIVKIDQKLMWAPDSLNEISKIELQINNMLQNIDQHCTTNVQLKIDKLHDCYFIQGNSTSYKTIKAGIIASMILQFDFMYISALRAKNIYYTIQLNGRYCIVPQKQIPMQIDTNQQVKNEYKIPNPSDYKTLDVQGIDSIGLPGQISITSNIQKNTQKAHLPVGITVDNIDGPVPLLMTQNEIEQSQMPTSVLV